MWHMKSSFLYDQLSSSRTSWEIKTIKDNLKVNFTNNIRIRFFRKKKSTTDSAYLNSLFNIKLEKYDYNLVRKRYE